jgi:hypothetical protein
MLVDFIEHDPMGPYSDSRLDNSVRTYEHKDRLAQHFGKNARRGRRSLDRPSPGGTGISVCYVIDHPSGSLRLSDEARSRLAFGSAP